MFQEMNQLSICLLFIFLSSVESDHTDKGCSMRDVMTCVIQLKSYNVPIDTNMMNVVFNISTEAKLVHVCRAYNNAMPCFQQRLATCASEKQRLRLAEVNRLLLFICAPFSLQRQKTLLKVGKCIGQVLNHPVVPNCPTKNHRFGHKLTLCRENCESNDVVCLMRVRMSELAVCSVIAIEDKCGREAADFYSYMQTAIIGEEFPIQCKYDFAVGKIRDMLNGKEYDSIEITTEASKNPFTVQELVLPTISLSKSREMHSVEDIPLLLTKNGKFVPNPELTKKALQLFQSERRKTASKKKEEQESEEETNLKKKKIVRTRNYSKLFRPSKFAEVNLDNKPKEPENSVIIQLVSSNEHPEDANKTFLEKSEENMPGFLQGARPIPEGTDIIHPKGMVKGSEPEEVENNSVIDDHVRSFKDSFPSLSAVRESYTPRVEAITVSTATTTTTQLPPTMTTTMTPYWTTTPQMLMTTTQAPSYRQWPVTTTTITPRALSTKPSSVDKFLPWYYNTFTTKKNDNLATSSPMFPYFNSESLPQTNQEPQPVDPYFNTAQNNFDSNQFATRFVSNMNSPQPPVPPSTPIILSERPSSQKISEELSNLINSSSFREKADAILTTAIDVLKPNHKVQQPFADQQPFYLAPNQNNQRQPISENNRTATGAFSELMNTIERISPSVIDNIREKLDSLGHN